MTVSTHPNPSAPCEHWTMDFIEPRPVQGYRYCLVIADRLSKHPAGNGTRSHKQTKHLFRDVIPRKTAV